jgi:LacI family transcriptional regulator
MAGRRPRLTPTIRDVANRAGVSISSVSRALNNHPDVSEELRNRVVKAAEGLTYTPDLVASGLRKGRTRTIGFVVRDISTPLFSDIVKGAEGVLRQAGYAMLLTNSDADPELDAEYVNLFRQRKVDGLILSLSSERHAATIAALRNVDVPLVLIDRELPFTEASSVVCDHHSGVTAATRHLLELGHRRIALVGGPTDVLASRERVRGYVDAHRDANVPIDESLIKSGSYTEAFGHDQTLLLLDAPEPPTALITGASQLTLGALSALNERRIKIPSRLSLIVCDDSALMRYVSPPLTVVVRDARRMGCLAAELMIGALEGEPRHRELVPTELVIRGSTGPPSQPVSRVDVVANGSKRVARTVGQASSKAGPRAASGRAS